MPWVQFLVNYDWKPSLKVMVAYKKGGIYLVKGEVARLAVEQGKAKMVDRPMKVKSCQRAT